jgi:multiple sugar transport system substrate-binding protein
VPEFEAIHALENLTPWVARSRAVDRSDNFPGIWDTNVVGARLYGVPWYVDTRVVFYRTDLLASVGYKELPKTWDEWADAMQKLRNRERRDQYPILLPTDEWPHPVTFALEEGAPLLRDGGRYADFEEPHFETAFNFYLSLYRRGFAPTLTRTDVANRYQQFATGDFAMLISGPWDVGEMRKRVRPDLPWSTAIMPGPGGKSTSLAGGSSLVIFRASTHKDAAWKLIEFLSEPAQQLRFYQISRDLPARRSVWAQAGIARDPKMASFREQLEHVTPTPQVPEWEEIATAITEEAEPAIRGTRSAQQTLAALDARVNRILTKRRWVLQQEASR